VVIGDFKSSSLAVAVFRLYEPGKDDACIASTKWAQGKRWCQAPNT